MEQLAVNRPLRICLSVYVLQDSGSLCESDLNECDSSPCRNGGTCTQGSSPDLFVCFCPGGFTGVRCESDVNECESSPCRNGGTCSQFVNRFSCVCAPGFTGTLCQTDLNECASSPCRNGGTCSNQAGRFVCFCGFGFRGTVCETPFSVCESSPCQNGATCFNPRVRIAYTGFDNEYTSNRPYTDPSSSTASHDLVNVVGQMLVDSTVNSTRAGDLSFDSSWVSGLNGGVSLIRNGIIGVYRLASFYTSGLQGFRGSDTGAGVRTLFAQVSFFGYRNVNMTVRYNIRNGSWDPNDWLQIDALSDTTNATLVRYTGANWSSAPKLTWLTANHRFSAAASWGRLQWLISGQGSGDETTYFDDVEFTGERLAAFVCTCRPGFTGSLCQTPL
jgi:hypothetical protein